MLRHIEYLTDTIELRFGQSVRYTGRVAHDATSALLYFVTDEDAEVISVDLYAYGLSTPQGHIWIKDWSEHAGIANQLVGMEVLEYKATATVGPFSSPAHLVKVPDKQSQDDAF